MQSSIMLDQRDKLRPTPDITYAEIGPNSPRKILLPRVEITLAPMLNSFVKRNVTRCYARKSIQLNLGL